MISHSQNRESKKLKKKCKGLEMSLYKTRILLIVSIFGNFMLGMVIASYTF